MGTDRDGLDPVDDTCDADRRGFLRSVGRLGAWLTAAWAGFATTREVAAQKPVTLQKLKPRSEQGAGLSVTGSLQVHSITRSPQGTPPQPLSGTAPSGGPALRGELMKAISRSGARLQLAGPMQVQGAQGDDEDTVSFSPLLRSMTRVHTLASAYAEGITLTRTGCEYRGGSYTGRTPLYYQCDRGKLTADLVRSQRVWALPGNRDSRRSTLLRFTIATPGSQSDRLAYAMELSLSSPGFDRYMDCLVFKLNGEEIHFSPTSSGTWLSLAELAGSGDGYHEMTVECDHQRGHLPVEFYWMCMTAQ